MKLELFKFDTCPYCQKVMQYIKMSGRDDIEYHDILQDESSYKRLLSVGTMDQVPCLFIDGQPLYESDDIIEWLKNNK